MIKGIDYPEWMDEIGVSMLQRGYLHEGENILQAYKRVSAAGANHLKGKLGPNIQNEFEYIMNQGWLCLASPVFSNMGSERGLPISCYGVQVDDSILGIGNANTELMRLTQFGGGVGMGYNNVRGRGSLIRGGTLGQSEGTIPWMKINDSTIIATNQGKVRRGAMSSNLSIYHPDIEEFLMIRKVHGDVNRQCLNSHHCVTIPKEFWEKFERGEEREVLLWKKLLKVRDETGEPYILFEDNMNADRPPYYVENNMWINMTNICTEIGLWSDILHTFVCCLSSLNLAKYNEWKDWRSPSGYSLPELAIYFLDAVLEEFIVKGKQVVGLENAVRFSEKSRALGLGVLGWHSYLQSEMIPFISLDAIGKTVEIFRFIQHESTVATQNLAIEFGEPEWCKGTGQRNTHLTAIAPTFSNSTINGASASTEPWAANIFNHRTAKGTFIRKNPQLEKLLQQKGEDNDTTWLKILEEGGSVLGLPFLTDEEKEVFLIFGEINQLELVRQAGVRQQYIDQAQSINLKFSPEDNSSWISQVHKEAHLVGLKTLYYMRSESLLKGDFGTRTSDCVFCEG